MDDRIPAGYSSLRQNSADDVHEHDDDDDYPRSRPHRSSNSHGTPPRRSSRYKDDLFDDDVSPPSARKIESPRRQSSPPRRRDSSPTRPRRDPTPPRRRDSSPTRRRDPSPPRDRPSPPKSSAEDKPKDDEDDNESGASARCKARYMGSVVVPKDSLDLATVRRKAQVCASQPLYIPIRNWKIFQKYGKKVMRVGRPYNMTLNIRDANVVFDCEARYITFPARRVYATVCEPCDTGTGLWIVEEPRPGSYLCHVLEGDDEGAMQRCEEALLEATGGWRLK